MNHGSLFSGIGGFDLAAEWAGWENKFHCEWNEFGQRVLKYYWPDAVCYGDITKTDFTVWRGKIDVLTGGFPCQPYSMAGKRLGKEDERHLWPEMLRAIREIQPRYVVGENVPGLINWSGGLVFEEVQSDLEAAGYEVIPFILPAAGVNAPHRRERVWFVAYRADSGIESLREQKIKSDKLKVIANTNNAGDNTRKRGNNGNGTKAITEREYSQYEFGGQSIQGATPNSASVGWVERRSDGNRIDENKAEWSNIQLESERFSEKRNASNARCSEWENRIHGEKQTREATKFGNGYTQFGRFFDFPTVEPTIRGGNDGFSSGLDGITFPKWRNESIKAYGNAIVPQVVYQIFKAINEYEFLKQ